MNSLASWSTQQLTELLALMSSLPADANVVQRALEHAVESLEGDVGAIVSAGSVVASLGYSAEAVPVEDLLAAAQGERAGLSVPGAGDCDVLVVACDELPGGRLLLGRLAPASFTSEERSLLRGFARVLSLTLAAKRTLQHEREQRLVSEREAQHRQDLLVALRERQDLMVRLSRIQRSISTRRPLHEVLQAIVVGAAELIGDEIAGLRLLDPDDPASLLLAASTGLTPEVQESSRRSPVGVGVGGQAVSQRALVLSEDYARGEHPISVFLADGVQSSMAAPVFQGDLVVGSLVVATRRPGRTYSHGEQEMLQSFAEHTGLALNDARTVAALQLAAHEASLQARHDALTGLPNRTYFLERLDTSLREAQASGVLFIDIDDFKLVNDTLGHPIGDALLRAVGERIVGCLRRDDVLSRLGGDEFAVLLRSTPADQVELAAERIRQSLNQPFHLPGHVVTIGASTGIVICQATAGSSADDLLRDADVAMYRAKALGKGRAVLFVPSMRVDLQARSRLERDLRLAIDNDELTVHYQPVMDVELNHVVGCEALVRWQHPELGLVPPSEFIPVAEDTGMIVAIGHYVLREATAQVASWNASRGATPLYVSVNVSARQVMDGTVIGHVREALRRSGLPGGLLTLELTESVFVHDLEAAAETMAELKALGVRLAIDDFGTGYSSLSYLARLPVDVLKVDKAFVATILKDDGDARLAAAVVALAMSLQLETIVEGVETTTQLVAMRALGCTAFQGYLWSMPVPPAGFLELTHRLSAPARLPGPRVHDEKRTLRSVR